MIPLSQPSITHQERNAVNQALNTGWISGTGPYVRDFETALKVQLGRDHALAVTNGTVALELVLRALGIGVGDEVIVPALTFAAPAAAVRAVGATPVLVDIDPFTWTIDPLDIPEASTYFTRAVIAVDLLGHPADFAWLDTVQDLSKRRNITIIEDAAQAHGAIYNRIGEEKAGALAYVSTFSFHANKAISTGEGGAVLTNDVDLAEKLRLIANHGMTSEKPYWHEIAGTNYRMTSLTAALGTAQVKRWDELTAARRDVAAAYDERLSPLFDSEVLYRRPVAQWAKESCWLYTVGSPYRQQLVEGLRAKGIDARAIWYALPDLPPYKQDGYFPTARKVSQEAFWLPTWSGMPIETIDYICEVIHDIPISTRVPS